MSEATWHWANKSACGHEICQRWGFCQIGNARDEETFLSRSVLSDDDVSWCRRELARRQERSRDAG